MSAHSGWQAEEHSAWRGETGEEDIQEIAGMQALERARRGRNGEEWEEGGGGRRGRDEREHSLGAERTSRKRRRIEESRVRAYRAGDGPENTHKRFQANYYQRTPAARTRPPRSAAPVVCPQEGWTFRILSALVICLSKTLHRPFAINCRIHSLLNFRPI